MNFGIKIALTLKVTTAREHKSGGVRSGVLPKVGEGFFRL
jgi:hypothetical protein